MAENVFIASDVDNTRWYMSSSTITRANDGWYIQVTRAYPDKSKMDDRFYVGVIDSDCKNGFGSVYARGNNEEEWVPEYQFNLADIDHVSDIIAKNLCSLNVPVKHQKGAKKPVKRYI
jgi:hypothetical protein